MTGVTRMTRVVVGVGFLALVGLVILGIVWAFTPDYGRVDRRSIDASLTREVGGGSGFGLDVSPCRRTRGRSWSCDVAAGSSLATYRLTMRDEHCWRAVKTRREGDGGPLPVRADGCVNDGDDDVDTSPVD